MEVLSNKSDNDASQMELYKNPISEPMASEKLSAKILKLTKKLAKVKLLRRGVKDLNKAFRKKEKG